MGVSRGLRWFLLILEYVMSLGFVDLRAADLMELPSPRRLVCSNVSRTTHCPRDSIKYFNFNYFYHNDLTCKIIHRYYSFIVRVKIISNKKHVV